MNHFYRNAFVGTLMLLATGACYAQERTITGTVQEKTDGKIQPIIGATVELPSHAAGTQTDAEGNFSLSIPEDAEKLIVSYIGYRSDTVALAGKSNIKVTLQRPRQLEEVVVAERVKSGEMSLLKTQKTEIYSEREFLKAACCNLGESFETVPSVDASFTDAVTGYRQIQMLGLAGPYTLITRENIPEVRGISAITGLTYTPGAWIEGMQLSKGTGSVVNGYESVAGQINLELKKPFEEKEEKLHLNLYQSTQGRTEANAIYRHEFSDGLSTNLMVHGNSRWIRNDQNNDGFLDQPLGEGFSALNRWFWFSKNGWETQFGVKGVYTDNYGGQEDYQADGEQITGKPWGFVNKTKRIEGWAKVGRIFPEKKGTSMGLQLSGVYHDWDTRYGQRNYNALQKTFYANLIFQTILGNTNHVLKTGLSSLVDMYDEKLGAQTFVRDEIVPGAFAEYSYSYLDKLNIVAGLRGDYHNLFGAFATPRLHVRYAPWENTALRASVGRAQRTANIFAENIGYLASNRKFQIVNPGTSDAYGLQPEVAWNYGVNLTQKFMLNYRDGAISADYYYTHFNNQIVTDIETPQLVQFYNLDGLSFANSFQVQLDYEPIRMLDVRLAYRWYDVKTSYSGILKEKPFVANHRAFANIAYETNNSWKFDYTVQWLSSKRVPDILTQDGFTPSEESPSFVLMNAQISKSWNDEKFELYAGGENLTGYMQPNPILGANAPYSQYFDASMIWGPVMGRNVYFGLRYRFK